MPPLGKQIAGSKGFKAKALAIADTAIELSNVAWGWDLDDLDEADRAYITPREAGIMVLWTGDVPTASFGHCVNENETLVISGTNNIQNLQMIREGADTATVTVSLEK